jgi:hypothetical protein
VPPQYLETPPMIDETSARPARRISLVARALRPVQREIGELQEATAFLVARKLYALRQPTEQVSPDDIAAKRESLARILELFDATVQELPEKHRSDTRLDDTRAAIDRLSRVIDDLAGKPE